MKWWLALLLVAGCVEEPEEGTVELEVLTYGSCPRLESASVTPLTVAIDQSATLEALASDVDGDALAYAWSAADGSFAAPTNPNTTYRCTSPGDKTLVLTYSDLPGCSKRAELRITCVP